MEKIIHRIWIGPAEMPEEYVEFGRQWKELNPGWQLWDWLEDDLGISNAKLTGSFGTDSINSEVLDDLMKRGEQPGADKIALATHYADVLAYELVYEYGGLYVNTDMQPVRPIQELLDSHPGLYTKAGAGKEDDQWIVNAVLWAPEPHDVFWRAVVKALPGRYFSMPGEYMSNTTGPHLITQVYNSMSQNLYVLDKSVFNPIHFTQVEFGKNAEFHPLDLPDETIAVHHWGHRRNRRNQRVLEG